MPTRETRRITLELHGLQIAKLELLQLRLRLATLEDAALAAIELGVERADAIRAAAHPEAAAARGEANGDMPDAEETRR
jgi:hypothetical protein